MPSHLRQDGCQHGSNTVPCGSSPQMTVGADDQYREAQESKGYVCKNRSAKALQNATALLWNPSIRETFPTPIIRTIEGMDSEVTGDQRIRVRLNERKGPSGRSAGPGARRSASSRSGRSRGSPRKEMAGFGMTYLAHDPYLSPADVRPWKVELVPLD
jgi:hypothetical protein